GPQPPYDVFVNVVGGVRVEEPGVDLAIALAVASAARGVPISSPHPPAPCGCFGELGLTGELRWVGHPERRLAEASRHGLAGVLAPAGSGEQAQEASTLRQALSIALPAGRTRPASVAA
ncbi:MAG TPA: magnesium chelatase domain-containing protein, partial [Solirubrobacteraceae bacterium]|nr:magnesium chelatase domain-containing protein [Solirubrobacteraceae bacterium]